MVNYLLNHAYVEKLPEKPQRLGSECSVNPWRCGQAMHSEDMGALSPYTPCPVELFHLVAPDSIDDISV